MRANRINAGRATRAVTRARADRNAPRKPGESGLLRWTSYLDDGRGGVLHVLKGLGDDEGHRVGLGLAAPPGRPPALLALGLADVEDVGGFEAGYEAVRLAPAPWHGSPILFMVGGEKADG